MKPQQYTVPSKVPDKNYTAHNKIHCHEWSGEAEESLLTEQTKRD